MAVRAMGSGAPISIGNPSSQPNAAINVKQAVNGASTVVLQRFTDTSSTGNLIEGWNAANNFQLFKIDTFGNLTANTFVAQNPSNQSNSVINIKQAVNGSGTVFIQRNTDSSPSGNLLQFMNAANNTTLAYIDVNGGAIAQSLTAVGGAITGGAGTVSIGGITATSATTGANGAPPAQVAGYIIINVAGTAMKIPYFNT